MSKKDRTSSPTGVAELSHISITMKLSKLKKSTHQSFPYSIEQSTQLPSELGVQINENGELVKIPNISKLLAVYKTFLNEFKKKENRIAFLKDLLQLILKKNPKDNTIIIVLNLLYEDSPDVLPTDLDSNDESLFIRFRKAVSDVSLKYKADGEKLPKKSLTISSLLGETIKTENIYLLTIFLPTIHLIIQMMELPTHGITTKKGGISKNPILLVLIFLITNGYSALPKKPAQLPKSDGFSRVDYVFDTAKSYTGITLSPETKGKLVGGGVAVMHFGAAMALNTLTGGASTIIGALAQISLYGMGILGAVYVHNDVEQFYKSEDHIKEFETNSEELKRAIKEHNELIKLLIEKKEANPLLYKLSQQFSFTIITSNYKPEIDRRLTRNMPALGRPHDNEEFIPEPVEEDDSERADIGDILTRNRQREINDLLRALKSTATQESAIRRKMAHMQRVIETFDWIMDNCPSKYSIFMILYIMGLYMGLTRLYSKKTDALLSMTNASINARNTVRKSMRKRRSRKLRETAHSADEFATVSRDERKYKSL